MVEYDRKTKEAPSAEQDTHHLCIVGIGGAGSNVLDRITLDRTVDANLVCVHTDVRVLSHSMAPTKVQLGADLMRGIGAGGDPDLGREAALFSKELIREELEGHDIIFICAGLGGGTGSGAAPVIAEIAKGTGALVIVVATMPFSFEGRRRLQQAQDSLEQLQKRADALVLFENNRMGELILPKDGIQKAFSQADQLIAQSLRAVSTMISTPGLVKLGLDDLTTALAASQGRCLFGFGEARGQNRGADALKRALKSPLIDQGRLLHQTQNLLVHIAGGDTLTLVEVEAVMKQLGRHVPDDTQILFGVAVNPKLGDSISVTLISSLGVNHLNAHAAAAPPAEMFDPPAIEERRSPVKEARKESSAEPVLQKPGPETETEPPAAVDPMVVTPASPKPHEPELFEEAEIRLPAGQPADEEEATPLLFGEEEAPPAVPKDDVSQEQQPEHQIADEPLMDLPDEPLEEESPAPVSAQVEPGQTSLATVVANSGKSLRGNGNAKRTPDPQPTLSLGGEDRGRFKDTEHLVVEGEDLDVPTWMRLRKKLKR